VIHFKIVDMFTDHPFAGSPLGVVPDAASLSTDEMRMIAAEINTIETAFVLPASSPDATYRVRVFNPAGESPHGSHSSFGTAATLVRMGRIPAGRTVQECGTATQLLDAGADRATLIGQGPVAGTGLDPEPLLAAVRLDRSRLADAAPMATGLGSRFPYLPVQAGAVELARPDYGYMAEHALPALCVFSWDHATSAADARVFAPGFGIPEDAACGPVAMALGAWLFDTGNLPSPDGTHEYTVRQGAGSGRPALLRCAVTIDQGRITRGAVTGQVVPVAHGEITVPVNSELAAVEGRR
jgi:trans-2,3-dihydro-3-hydroxyanthranilate isomerase